MDFILGAMYEARVESWWALRSFVTCKDAMVFVLIMLAWLFVRYKGNAVGACWFWCRHLAQEFDGKWEMGKIAGRTNPR